MKKLAWVLGMGVLLLAGQALRAQDDAVDCSSAQALAAEVDALYSEFVVARSDHDLAATMNAVEVMQGRLELLLDECAAPDVAEALPPEQLGLGTYSDPYAFNQSVNAGRGTALRVTRIVRPADDWLRDAVEIGFQEPGEGQEYVVLEVEVACAPELRVDCEVDSLNFRLKGDLGVEYLPVFVHYDELLDVRVMPSRSRTGTLPFLIDAQDVNLRLIYSHDAYTTRSSPVYYRAQPSVQIAALVELIVRNGPGTRFAPMAGLRPGQVVTAIGRNADGSWIRIADGWVSAAYVSTQASDILNLPVASADD